MDAGEGRLVKGTRTATRELEPAVQNLLRDCEYRIEHAYDDAWHALKQIHDDKLYKADGYTSFKLYVEQRWGYSKSRAHRLIDHVKIVEYLKEQGVENLPSSEAHSQALVKLRRISKSEDDFLQRAGHAWEVAKDTAPKTFDVPKVTAEHIESTMSQYGIYRNAKSKADTTASDCRTVLTKFAQCDARKMTPEDFVKRYELKGFPSTFPRDLQWLIRCAELLGVNES